MKSMIIFILIMGTLAQAQDMSSIDNQCRIEAKEMAVKSYQSCVVTAKTARLEQIRKEYQEKLTELKKQYEGQLLDLKKQNADLKTQEKQNNNSKSNVSESTTQPTVVLKKGSPYSSATSVKKSATTKSVSPKATKSSSIPAKITTSTTIITEAELEKSAPTTIEQAPIVTYETNEITGEVEDLQLIDPSLPTVEAQ